MGETLTQRESKFISIRRNDLLKIIALVTMFIDHIAHVGLLEMILTHFNVGIEDYDKYYTICRTIGRIAFPIFAYQVALGFSKTSNLRKYIMRLFTFALVSYIPYIVFNNNFVIHPLHFNVIFMLLIGVIVILLFEHAKVWYKKGDLLSEAVSLAMIILMIMIIIMPQYLEAYFVMHPLNSPTEALFSLGKIDFHLEYDFAFSYGTYGILMILFFHLVKGKPLYMIGGYILLEWIGFTLGYANSVYSNSLRWFGEQYTYIQSFAITPKTQFLIDYDGGFSKLDGFFFQMRSILALPFIILLERFYVKVKLNKFVGYWFYPLHITFLLICTFILKLVL